MNPDPLAAVLDQLAAHHEQIARLPRAWKNPAYRRARRLGQAPAHLAADTEWPEPDLPDYVPAEWLGGNGTNFPWS